MTEDGALRAGDRCPVQPIGDRDFGRDVGLPGVQHMTFRAAMQAGYIKWSHPVVLGTERSYALWTAKAAEQAEYVQGRAF